jgi:hypothetical protein
MKKRRCTEKIAAVLLILFFLKSSFLFAQGPVEVKGMVKDDMTGEGIPGTNVVIKGSSKGTSTDRDGNFTIAAASTDILVFSFVGYESLEEPVRNRTVIQVSLKSSNAGLEEVLVVGYGKVRKTDLTGSVGQVKMEELVKAPVTSFTDALAGRVAGVQVSSNDGQPGSAPNIIIRGANSLTQNNSPLYVIDGFPVENPNNAALNPDEIESMNILKDASATDLWFAGGKRRHRDPNQKGQEREAGHHIKFFLRLSGCAQDDGYDESLRIYQVSI